MIHVEVVNQTSSSLPRYRVWRSTGGQLDVPTGDEIILTSTEAEDLATKLNELIDDES
jgi:hypothetical protein